MDLGCSDRAAGGADGAGVALHDFFDDESEGIELIISARSVAFAKSSAVAVEEVEGFAVRPSSATARPIRVGRPPPCTTRRSSDAFTVPVPVPVPVAVARLPATPRRAASQRVMIRSVLI